MAELPAISHELVTHYEVDGVRLACIEAGVGGSPLLLVHGFTGCKEDFADEIDLLVEMGYHVVAPDLRGHGSSDAPADESAYSLELFATELFALATVLGWERFDLLGHSMGGMVVQLMALRHPERIDRLVLMDTHHGVIGTLDLGLVELGVELARTQGLAVIQEILKSGADPLANPAYTRLCAERPGYQEFAEGKMLRSSPSMYAAMLYEMATVEDRLDRLAVIGSTTLVLVGEFDQPFLEASAAMAGIIPDAEMVVLPGGGHSPQFEATEHWRRSVHAFLGPVTVSQ